MKKVKHFVKYFLVFEKSLLYIGFIGL